MKKQEERELRLTYEAKDKTKCPVCEESFHREELLSGGGRLIAGPLTDELHRRYEPSAKFGVVYPLAYLPTVCPACWFASSEADFTALPADGREGALEDRDGRIADLQSLFPSADFTSGRDLSSGAAAQYLALRCYSFYPKEFSPTLKQGMAAIRAGWLFDALAEKEPGQNWDWVATLCKRKARFLYAEAVLREQSGQEALSGVKNFGPDTDKNYGYEGALYLKALLELKYGPRESAEARVAALGDAKRTIAKIFGLGKSSKAKPGPLLEKARDLYDTINKELNETDE